MVALGTGNSNSAAPVSSCSTKAVPDEFAHVTTPLSCARPLKELVPRLRRSASPAFGKTNGTFCATPAGSTVAAATLKAQYQSKPKSGLLHITKDSLIWWGAVNPHGVGV